MLKPKIEKLVFTRVPAQDTYELLPKAQVPSWDKGWTWEAPTWEGILVVVVGGHHESVLIDHCS